MKSIDKASFTEKSVIEDAWLNLPSHINDSVLRNPIKEIPELFHSEPYLFLTYMLGRPEYIAAFCKYVLNVTLLPYQSLFIRTLWNTSFPLFIASRGASKSWQLALYSILRATFMPGRKIVICGASFRQSKVVYDYIDTIYNNAPLFRDMVKEKGAGGQKANDMWRYVINGSTIVAIPMGSGEKIRGLRSQDLIVDEFKSVSVEIFEEVMSGFLAVSSDPISNVQKAAAKRKAEELGIVLEENDDPIIKRNQLILSGTAYYSFNHFCKYWEKWKSIIQSGGNKDGLSDYNEEEIPENLNYKDYGIIRFPYELVPQDFMDEDQIARTKSSISSGVFLNEFGACIVDPESLITTDKGYKKYQDIVIGDKVLTHKGRFRPVTKKTFRSYQGEIHKVTLWGCNLPITVTEDHAFLDNNEFMAVKDLEEFQSPKIQEMSDIQEIDVADRVYSGAVYDNYIYTKYPKQRISQKQIDLILKLHNEGFSKAEITNKVFGKTKKNSNYSSVYNTIKNNTKRKKCAINRKIDLSVRFGRIIGYYAAEGSSGSDGRYIEFALGKHEQHYVDQISEDIESCFGVSPKIYYSKDNVCRVIVTSRIVQELIKSICPGDCYTKTIDPAILYSNEYFIKGFLQGVLNGDGCLYDEKYITIQLASKQLICQIRNCLLIKDISSSLIKPSWRKKNSVIRGKKVNQSEVYRLDIRGFNANKLYKNIYDINHKDSNFTKNPYYWSEDSFGFHKIRERSKEFYSGRVYNLEVDEDHSYCINDICCHNCFATDSDGFFKRSLIETCVAHEGKIYKKKEDCYFKPRLYGDPSLKYVMGIDPASERDNFSIVLLELREDHRRIVYCWTTKRSQHQARLKEKLVEEHDFYSYINRKVRNLMERFNIEHIIMDSQGGGYPVLESFKNQGNMKEYEKPILEVRDPKKPKPSDIREGHHIVELASFADGKWFSEANHGLKKDLEEQDILFPSFDALELGMSIEKDKLEFRTVDTLQDCVQEIEELKDELCTIVMEQTNAGREKFVTPEEVSGGKKKRQKKDRYSSLVIANMAARLIQNDDSIKLSPHIGGFAAQNKQDEGPMYYGNEVYSNAIRGVYDDY